MQSQHHILVRGILLKGKHVLVAHAKGTGNTLLPGGHVSENETQEQALQRELHEALGLAITISSYIGSVEHQWTEGETRHMELNHVFIIRTALPHPEIVSKEDHLEFLWLTVDELEKFKMIFFGDDLRGGVVRCG